MRLVPLELIALTVAVLILALVCTWSIRSDWHLPEARIDWWGLAEGFVGMFLILCMLAASALQVLVRYLFADDVDMPWTEEFGRLAMIWAAFWGAAAVQRVDDHIRMTAVYDLLSAPLQKAVRVLGDILMILILAPIVWLGWETALGLDVMASISLGLPLSVFAYPVPIAAALMMVHTVALLIGRLVGREPGRSHAGLGA